MEKFNSRDLIMTAGLMQSMLCETPFADQEMEEFLAYTEEDLIEDSMDYCIQPCNK